jgi:hypothetical protein
MIEYMILDLPDDRRSESRGLPEDEQFSAMLRAVGASPRSHERPVVVSNEADWILSNSHYDLLPS